ncbi:MAG TPA: beta-galactosidase [Candidatus Binataceae bacterium]|nr:beta-galactosidase [Candidatus Binataceae bacterium]
MRAPKRFVVGLMAVCIISAETAAYRPVWAGSYPPVGGVYALGRFDEKVLASPYVDGLTLRFWWDKLEPSEGHFNWEPIDRDIARARSHGKKVSITVAAGYNTPAWVYTAGAKPFMFRWTKIWGPPLCSEQRLPVPWDPVYLAKWGAFVHQMGLRYDPDPAVVLIKITGVNSGTGETNLPRERGKTIERKGQSCTTSDDLAEWQRVGYSPENLIRGWKQIADAFSQSFPHKKISIMTGPTALPVLDSSAEPAARFMRRGRRRGAGGEGGNESVALIREGINSYDGQFVVQNNALSDFFIWPEVQNVSGRVTTGYQMLWNASDDPMCRMTHKVQPCPPGPTLKAAIDRGIAAGAKFLEIYSQDVQNPELQSLLAQTHQRLSGGMGR